MKPQQIILKALNLAKQDMIKEIKAEGHNNTGALIESIEARVNETIDGITGELYMLERAEFINVFTPGSRIPFSGRTGRGGTSKYIQGLVEYFKSKGAENPLRAAFATAWKQKKEGRPTKGSYLFSKNGRRTGFLDVSLDRMNEVLYDYIGSEFEKNINAETDKF